MGRELGKSDPAEGFPDRRPVVSRQVVILLPFPILLLQTMDSTADRSAALQDGANRDACGLAAKSLKRERCLKNCLLAKLPL